MVIKESLLDLSISLEEENEYFLGIYLQQEQSFQL